MTSFLLLHHLHRREGVECTNHVSHTQGYLHQSSRGGGFARRSRVFCGAEDTSRAHTELYKPHPKRVMPPHSKHFGMDFRFLGASHTPDETDG